MKDVNFDLVSTMVKNECERQEKLWGKQTHSPYVWLGILLEEVGEVAAAINDNDFEQAGTELIQCAAVIMTWLMSELEETNHES